VKRENHSPGPNGQTIRSDSRPAAAVQGSDEPHHTDLGNAQRFIRRHGHILHYCHPWKKWLVWDGKVWTVEDRGQVTALVKETITHETDWVLDRLRELSKKSNGLTEEEDVRRETERKRLTRLLVHLQKWENAKPIAYSIALAQSEPGIPIVPNELDRSAFLLNVVNGTIDLRTGQLRPHDQADLMTKLSPVAYDPSAQCPLWLRFLNRIMDGNEDLISYLQRTVGYCLTADVREQVLWFCHGTGANGKSTFLNTVMSLLGPYALQTAPELLLEKRNEAHPTERADLHGRRLACTIEVETGKRIAEALMKTLTGGDPVRARRMREDFWEFVPTCKLFLVANHKPEVRGTDHAVWRRIKLIPFTVTISDDEKDTSLGEKLKSELSGILNWALAGCLAWQQYGLGEPDEVRLATGRYREEQDTLASFIAENCITDHGVSVGASALLDAFHQWTGDKSVSHIAFSRMMEAKGYSKARSSSGMIYQGLGLLDTVRNRGRV
jgi:putative DNA primase/helicase